MTKTDLDTLDNKIIRLLTKNGRMPIGDMAKSLNVTAPTVRRRIKDLENGAGDIQPSQRWNWRVGLWIQSA